MDEDALKLIACLAMCLLTPSVFISLGLLGRAILRSKGYSGWAGFALGALLGIVGVVIALVLPKATRFGTQVPVSPRTEALQSQALGHEEQKEEPRQGSLTAKMTLILCGSCLIYLSILAAAVAAVVTLFSNVGADESLVVASARTFFSVLYIPTLLILVMSMVAILLFAALKLFREIDADAAKLQILLLAAFVFAVGGSVGPLMDYRPAPTMDLLALFTLLVAVSLAIHIYLLFFKSTASLIEKGKRGLLLFPYVIESVFAAMSLVQAVLLYVGPSGKAHGWLNVCAGIVSPLWAIACLFIPTAILYWLDDHKRSQGATREA